MYIFKKVGDNKQINPGVVYSMIKKTNNDWEMKGEKLLHQLLAYS